jgi:hypothetical protein
MLAMICSPTKNPNVDPCGINCLARSPPGTIHLGGRKWLLAGPCPWLACGNAAKMMASRLDIGLRI